MSPGRSKLSWTYLSLKYFENRNRKTFNRAALYGPKPEYTELDLDDKDCVIGNYR